MGTKQLFLRFTYTFKKLTHNVHFTTVGSIDLLKSQEKKTI